MQRNSEMLLSRRLFGVWCMCFNNTRVKFRWGQARAAGIGRANPEPRKCQEEGCAAGLQATVQFRTSRVTLQWDRENEAVAGRQLLS